MNAQKVKNVDGKVGEGVKFERIRRITGYLVGTIDRFNDAKTAEVRDRVKHKVGNEVTELQFDAPEAVEAAPEAEAKSEAKLS